VWKKESMQDGRREDVEGTKVGKRIAKESSSILESYKEEWGADGHHCAK